MQNVRVSTGCLSMDKYGIGGEYLFFYEQSLCCLGYCRFSLAYVCITISFI
jgi:hypothetical protein